MTAPDDLAARVLSAIADVERIAHATAPPGGWLRWQVHGDGADRNSTTRDDRHPERVDDVAGVPIAAVSAAVGQHLVRHDPKAVLRRCAADRRIVALHTPVLGHHEYWDRPKAAFCALCSAALVSSMRAGDLYPCRTLRLLAVGYGVLEPTEAS